MFNVVRKNLTAAFALALLLSGQAFASTSVVTEVADTDRQHALSEQKYLFWQQINEARRNPSTVLERLGVSEEQARAALGEDASAIDNGFPPLAWNDLLAQSASEHGNDMVNQVFYSHYSPDGSGPADRIAATGYQAVAEDETMGVLAFSSYMEFERAVALLLDNMLRDELSGFEGVSRNIFSSELTEVGISFFAETLPVLADTPYVYLLVLDFAKPIAGMPSIVGRVDSENRLAARNVFSNFWDFLPILPGGGFQLELSEDGTEVVAFDEEGVAVQRIEYQYGGDVANRYADLRDVRN